MKYNLSRTLGAIRLVVSGRDEDIETDENALRQYTEIYDINYTSGFIELNKSQYILYSLNYSKRAEIGHYNSPVALDEIGKNFFRASKRFSTERLSSICFLSNSYLF